jgi:KipI family sensor histidine kinase inhibitor
MGERAILVTLGDRVDLAVNARARRLAAAIEALRSTDPRFGRSIPAAASILVPFDPLTLDTDDAAKIVSRLADEADSTDPTEAIDSAARDVLTRRPIDIPVHYGGADGPDLADVAAAHSLTSAHVVELHAGSTWTALFLGFAPGFAYLGPLTPELATPRRATPRERVPTGSVAIGGDQTAVFPFAMPSGWQIIGRAEVSIWDLGRAQPNLISPGDRVRFVPR